MKSVYEYVFVSTIGRHKYSIIINWDSRQGWGIRHPLLVFGVTGRKKKKKKKGEKQKKVKDIHRKLLIQQTCYLTITDSVDKKETNPNQKNHKSR